MSDFLSNLLTRSFVQAPVVQPRLSSLFERMPVAGEAFESGNPSTPGQAPGSSITALDQERPATLPKTTPWASTPPANAAIPTEPPSARRAEAVERVAESPLSGRSPSPDLRPVDESTAPVERPAQPSPSLSDAVLTSVSPSQRWIEDTQPIHLHPPAKPAAQTVSDSPRSTVHRESRRGATATDPPPVDGPAITEETIPNLATALPPSIGPRQPLTVFDRLAVEIQENHASMLPRGPHVVPGRTQRAAVAPSEPTPAITRPPTVRITIGQVEVRAMTAPAPPISQGPRPGAPRRNPMLSLDDYLKRPRGGGR